MDNGSIHVDIALRNYKEMLKIKPKHLKSKYPFTAMDEDEVIRTLKKIELVYQDLTPTVSAFVIKYDDNKEGKTNTWKKKGGGDNSIVVFTM
jgi:hypothetical protein